MELILWRHAEAEDGPPDLERRLTARGRKQAASMAHWLQSRLPPETRVLASPAVRAEQTARALDRPIQLVDALAPGAEASALLLAAGWPAAGGSVLLVGHQPTLGRLADRLLLGNGRDFALKKGAILWLSGREGGGRPEVVLRAALSPDLL